VLAVLGAILERLALGTRAVLARRVLALWAAVLALSALALGILAALPGMIAPLLAVVGLTGVTRGAAWAAAAVGGRTARAALAAGVGRFHLRTV
jgi:hypothetical protein